jgi:cytochrome P450
MLHVMTSPLVYATLQCEIDTAVRTGKISSPTIRDVEARALSYLQAVILEGLRIAPPTGGLLSKVVPPEGDTISGVFVPGGTEVATNTWSIMRDKDVFGQEPEFFNPERWLGVSEEQYAKMARVVDLIFGHGKYKCLGRTVACIELNKIFVEVSETERGRAPIESKISVPFLFSKARQLQLHSSSTDTNTNIPNQHNSSSATSTSQSPTPQDHGLFLAQALSCSGISMSA